MQAPRRVFFIGLDAAECSLVEAWMRDGTLPTLRELQKRGMWGRLASVADNFPAAVWPCLAYGTNPARNNMFSSFPLAGDDGQVTTLRSIAASDPPFMACGPRPWPRTVIVDVPKLKLNREIGMTQVVAWGAHAAESEFAAHPPELAAEIRRVVGSYPLKPLEEEHNDQSEAYYLELRRKILCGVERRRELLSYLLKREPDWELFVSVWAESHSAGHRLWHFLDPGHPWYRDDAPALLKNALRDIYSAIDNAIGSLLKELPADTVVMVASVHGMVPNYNAQEMVARLLERWFAPPQGSGVRNASLLADASTWVRRLTPARVRDTVKHWLPESIRYGARMQAMMSVFGAGRWPTMKAYCLPTDDNGYVRVNLKGRDDPGLVEPGVEYETLLNELADELSRLRNIDTGAQHQLATGNLCRRGTQPGNSSDQQRLDRVHRRRRVAAGDLAGHDAGRRRRRLRSVRRRRRCLFGYRRLLGYRVMGY